jgi:hypothetical protein
MARNTEQPGPILGTRLICLRWFFASLSSLYSFPRVAFPALLVLRYLSFVQTTYEGVSPSGEKKFSESLE